MPLARLYLTPGDRQPRLLWCRKRVDWRVEWHSVVFSEENSFCLYASDRRTRVLRRLGERRLPECINPRHTGPTSGFMVWGAISYKTPSHLVFLQSKVNIAQIVNPLLLPFFRYEDDVLFQQDNTRPHTAAATQRAFHGVQ